MENGEGAAVGAAAFPEEDSLVPRARIHVLGKFAVQVADSVLPESAWQQRRAAKAVVKLLAIEPKHSLHRDQVLETLWPDADPESASSSFAKALHTARRALEPQLQAREQSTYLHLRSDILSLDTQDLWIDVDHFQTLAAEALRSEDIAAYEAALAAYAGELLPEDRYEPWVARREAVLAESLVELLLRGATVLQQHESYGTAAEWLQRALEQDETREDIHRRLMWVYVDVGSRHQALRQYQRCRDVLQRELDVEPEEDTEKLYQDILANRVEKRVPAPALDTRVGEIPAALSQWRSISTPLVGRDSVLLRLQEELARAEQGVGGTVIVSGEAGVGKTRLIVELVESCARRGVLVLWGTSGVHGSLLPYGPFVEALEAYFVRRPRAERADIAALYPELVRLVPSLAQGSQLPPASSDPDVDRTRLFPAIVRLLTDLSWTRPLLLVLGDLHLADSATAQLLQYLGRLAIQRRWLVIGTYREGDLLPRSEIGRMIRSTSVGLFCRTIELRCLARHDCDTLVRALLPGGDPDEALLEYIHALSLGNPLFIEELIRTMREQGNLSLEECGWHLASEPRRVPTQVRHLVEDSVGDLDETVQRVLTLAATADAAISLENLRAAAAALTPPIPDDVLLDALDQALDCRILEERDEGFVFRHPLFQSALEEHLSHHRRAQFRAALTHLHDETVLHHGFEQANPRGTATVRRSEHLAESLPPAQAAAALGDQVDQLDQAGLSIESARAREKLAQALKSMARYERALNVLNQARLLYQAAGDRDGLARIAAQTAKIQMEQGNLAV